MTHRGGVRCRDATLSLGPRFRGLKPTATFLDRYAVLLGWCAVGHGGNSFAPLCVLAAYSLLNLHFRFPSLCLFPLTMTLQNREAQMPFTTKDGSTIRSLLDRTNAPVQLQSLAEATLTFGQATERHYHRLSEEIYYLLEGTGEMELDGERQAVRAGDAILIPPGAWHQITGTSAIPLRFLCACAPPYEHGDTYFE